MASVLPAERGAGARTCYQPRPTRRLRHRRRPIDLGPFHQRSDRLPNGGRRSSRSPRQRSSTGLRRACPTRGFTGRLRRRRRLSGRLVLARQQPQRSPSTQGDNGAPAAAIASGAGGSKGSLCRPRRDFAEGQPHRRGPAERALTRAQRDRRASRRNGQIGTDRRNRGGGLRLRTPSRRRAGRASADRRGRDRRSIV